MQLAVKQLTSNQDFIQGLTRYINLSEYEDEAVDLVELINHVVVEDIGLDAAKRLAKNIHNAEPKENVNIISFHWIGDWPGVVVLKVQKVK